MLRDGKAPAVGPTNGETSQSDWRTATLTVCLKQRSASFHLLILNVDTP